MYDGFIFLFFYEDGQRKARNQFSQIISDPEGAEQATQEYKNKFEDGEHEAINLD